MTSGNGSSPLPAAATGSAPQNGEQKARQAVVRPQILTHVIEGFVIQEGAEPFPSHRSRVPGAQEKSQQVAPAVKTPPQDTTTDSELEEPRLPECKADADPPKLKCELCGRVDLENKFKRSKRFCSMACAKRYNVGFTKRVGLFQTDHSKRRRPRKSRPANPTADATKQITRLATPSSPGPPPAGSTLKQPKSRESSRCSDNSSYEDLQSPPSASSSPTRQDLDMRGVYPGDPLKVEHNFLPSDPAHWKVDDVYEFIRSLPGCRDIWEEFCAQEIDLCLDAGTSRRSSGLRR